jgi:hypothetical protein
MPTVEQPNSVPARIIRVAISPRFAAMSFPNGRGAYDDVASFVSCAAVESERSDAFDTHPSDWLGKMLCVAAAAVQRTAWRGS